MFKQRSVGAMLLTRIIQLDTFTATLTLARHATIIKAHKLFISICHSDQYLSDRLVYILFSGLGT
jgi:hypothetical protein